MKPYTLHLFTLIQILFLLSGCSMRQPASVEPYQVTVEEIRLTTEENVELAGTLFRVENEDIAVVLTHSGVMGEDQTGLHPFARNWPREDSRC